MLRASVLLLALAAPSFAQARGLREPAGRREPKRDRDPLLNLDDAPRAPTPTELRQIEAARLQRNALLRAQSQQ